MTDTTQDDKTVDPIEAQAMRNEELRKENDHLFKAAAMAESMVAQLEVALKDMACQKLAALLLAGEIKPHEYEDRRHRALHEISDRTTVMRRRAERAVESMNDMAVGRARR